MLSVQPAAAVAAVASPGRELEVLWGLVVGVLVPGPFTHLVDAGRFSRVYWVSLLHEAAFACCMLPK